jgi:molybdopterin-containing oxidoreductase family iron-sulfur binding subunit
MKKEEGVFPDTRRRSIPVLCGHCENPSCLVVCPTGATTQSNDGVVAVDKDLCVGCRACITACPYGARYIRSRPDGYFGNELSPYEKAKYSNMPVGVVDKCNFCADRREQGLKPACVQTCMTLARTFGSEEDMMDLVLRRNGYRLRPDLDNNPSVYYLP